MRLFLAMAVLAVSACHGDHDHPFETFMACVDEHTDEGLTEPQSIAHCLIDYPFGDGLTTQAECEEYVELNGDYADSREEGCMLFLEELGG